MLIRVGQIRRDERRMMWMESERTVNSANGGGLHHYPITVMDHVLGMPKNGCCDLIKKDGGPRSCIRQK